MLRHLVATAARRASNASTAVRASTPSHAKRCLAMTPPSEDKPQLVYFAFRGRALACRVALFNSLGKDGWTDERVSLPRFKKAPKPARDPARVDAEYVTNNLPQLNLPCGSRVTQSHAIARFAAKASCGALPEHHVVDLYPADARDALLVDEAIAVIDQILLLTPKDADAPTRLRNREAFADSGFLRVGMELLEGRLARSGGPFLLGDRLSVADLFNAVSYITSLVTDDDTYAGTNQKGIRPPTYRVDSSFFGITVRGPTHLYKRSLRSWRASPIYLNTGTYARRSATSSTSISLRALIRHS